MQYNWESSQVYVSNLLQNGATYGTKILHVDPCHAHCPLLMLTSSLFLATTSRHVLYALPTPTCCRFLRSTQPLLPAVSALLPPQSGTHSLLAFALVPHHTHSVIILKLTGLQFPHEWLRFCFWLTLQTVNDFINLLTLLFINGSFHFFVFYISTTTITVQQQQQQSEATNDKSRRNVKNWAVCIKHIIIIIIIIINIITNDFITMIAFTISMPLLRSARTAFPLDTFACDITSSMSFGSIPESST